MVDEIKYYCRQCQTYLVALELDRLCWQCHSDAIEFLSEPVDIPGETVHGYVGIDGIVSRRPKPVLRRGTVRSLYSGQNFRSGNHPAPAAKRLRCLSSAAPVLPNPTVSERNMASQSNLASEDMHRCFKYYCRKCRAYFKFLTNMGVCSRCEENNIEILPNPILLPGQTLNGFADEDGNLVEECPSAPPTPIPNRSPIDNRTTYPSLTIPAVPELEQAIIRGPLALERFLDSLGGANSGLFLPTIRVTPFPRENLEIPQFEAMLEAMTEQTPLSYEEINKLPSVTIDDNQIALGFSCSICLEKYVAKDVGTKLSCDHIFHPMCIRRWLLKQATCPICRQQEGECTDDVKNYEETEPRNGPGTSGLHIPLPKREQSDSEGYDSL